MGGLNPGWKVWRFDQIAENIGERADPTTDDDSELYIGLEHMDTDSLRVRRWGSKTDLIGQKLKMRKGDILFARRNAYLKRVAITPHDAIFFRRMGWCFEPIPILSYQSFSRSSCRVICL